MRLLGYDLVRGAIVGTIAAAIGGAIYVAVMSWVWFRAPAGAWLFNVQNLGYFAIVTIGLAAGAGIYTQSRPARTAGGVLAAVITVIVTLGARGVFFILLFQEKPLALEAARSAVLSTLPDYIAFVEEGIDFASPEYEAARAAAREKAEVRVQEMTEQELLALAGEYYARHNLGVLMMREIAEEEGLQPDSGAEWDTAAAQVQREVMCMTRDELRNQEMQYQARYGDNRTARFVSEQFGFHNLASLVLAVGLAFGIGSHGRVASD
jgi:hypothetical protein